MSLIGALAKAAKAGETAKKTAPFYSAVDEALANLPRPKGTGAEFFTELTKQAGVKKAELADRKLEQAFKAKGKMTKEEAQQVLKDNPPPRLQEREFTEISDDERENLLRDRIEISGYDSWDEVPSRVIQKWNDEIDADMEKYGDYKTAGGKNYREILLKLPNENERIKTAEENVKRLKEAYRQDRSQSNYFAVQNAELELDVAKIGQSGYRSSHWKEDPNVLAHMRVQDRRGPNGEKILHVEEIQSDWHQEGRKKGYKPDDYIEQSNALETEFRDLANRRGQLLNEAERIGYRGEGHRALIDEANSITPKLMQLQEQRDKMQNVISYGVPDAPFKKNWHELAMKRLLNYAADNGYDSIAITPGAEQAKRFNLRNRVEQVSYTPATKNLMAFDRSGNAVVNESNVNPEDLEKYLGVGVTERLNQAEFEGPSRVLRGESLEVGGEGMKGFYDQILPNYLNTFGKSYGAKVEPMSIDMGGFKVNRDSYPLPYRLELANSPDIISRFATAEEAWAEAQRMGQMPLHNFRITPEMRESIKQKGLPLYQQIGIPTAGAGAASQMPEQMQEPALEPEVKKAVGGAINFDTAPDMSDQGRMIQGAPFKRGGKVNLTTNRDTMFLELSNKKLKRK
jgi:hypothetical protein